MNRTGRALGTLDPVIYFENASGHILLPPVEIGHGPETARRLYEERYRAQGYEWREAGTLWDVDKLQKRLVDQGNRETRQQREVVSWHRDQGRAQVSSNLRQRMTSADCDAWERDFIRYWLELDDEKKKQFEQRFAERNQYLWAREMDSGTQVADRMKE